MHLKSFNPQKNAGFTLIELLIGLTLGLIVIASTLTLYVITTRSSSDLLQSTRLNHDLETVMQIMTHDIRRAGYQGSSPNAIPSLETYSSGTSFDACILYSYWDDQIGLTPAIKYYGFQLQNNAIRLRKSGLNNNNCDSSANNWESITEDNVTQITELTFSDDDSQCFNATTTSTGLCTIVVPAASPGNSITKISHITISLSGALVQDLTVKKTLEARVTVANHCIYSKGQPPC
jgi:prepilin-type N-terminal cleavage/methylation domain-containing protein